jgi:hypothetical protein
LAIFAFEFSGEKDFSCVIRDSIQNGPRGISFMADALGGGTVGSWDKTFPQVGADLKSGSISGRDLVRAVVCSAVKIILLAITFLLNVTVGGISAALSFVFHLLADRLSAGKHETAAEICSTIANFLGSMACFIAGAFDYIAQRTFFEKSESAIGNKKDAIHDAMRMSVSEMLGADLTGIHLSLCVACASVKLVSLVVTFLLNITAGGLSAAFAFALHWVAEKLKSADYDRLADGIEWISAAAARAATFFAYIFAFVLESITPIQFADSPPDADRCAMPDSQPANADSDRNPPDERTVSSGDDLFAAAAIPNIDQSNVTFAFITPASAVVRKEVTSLQFSILVGSAGVKLVALAATFAFAVLGGLMHLLAYLMEIFGWQTAADACKRLGDSMISPFLTVFRRSVVPATAAK